MRGGLIMEKVPKMLSTKDVSYISDMFNWNYIAFKKINDYITFIHDEETLEYFKELIAMHVDNCEHLVKLLESGD